MPNALAAPATPASLRKERRWSVISRCPTRLLVRDVDANRVPKPGSIPTTHTHKETSADPSGPSFPLRARRRLGAQLVLEAGLSAPTLAPPKILLLLRP